MDGFQTFVLLMFAAAILVGIAQKIHIPYPIALVVGGLAIGFNPYLKAMNLDPTLVLVIVLPPLLYYAAFGISFREFKHDWREILSLSLGLVIFTTLSIGVLFKWLFPEWPWALAFAFGAIVSPPDAIAATTILKRFAINNRLMTILEGESLVNDASALVLYKLAVVALLSGTFSFAEGSIDFVETVTGGIIVGLIMGYLLQNFSRHYLDPVVGVVFSFTIPYITYILANSIGVSGVLAVVVNGLMGSKVLIKHSSSLRRILGFAAWDIFIILMNCFVFILIGLQLRWITSVMTNQQLILYTGYAVLIFLAMLAVRMLWVYARGAWAYITAFNDPKMCGHCPQILREATLTGWAGMRGIVSLVAALALPFALPDGTPLEGRNEVIFITFVVILLTLIIPGLTLAPLIQWLKIHHQPDTFNVLSIRKRLTKVAQETIEHLFKTKRIDEEEHHFLKSHLNLQDQALRAPANKKMPNLNQARSEIIQAQRKKLFELWEILEIDDNLIIQLEHELDLEETHFARAELK